MTKNNPGIHPLCAMLLLIFLPLRPIDASDTFWHLQSGKYIWQTKSFIYPDFISIAADVPVLPPC